MFLILKDLLIVKGKHNTIDFLSLPAALIVCTISYFPDFFFFTLIYSQTNYKMFIVQKIFILTAEHIASELNYNIYCSFILNFLLS